LTKRHLKRYPAPRFWHIKVKENKFTIRPSPGPHPLNFCIPLGIILRDILKYALTLSEVKKILSQRKVMVDGKIRTDYKFPVGLMDVIHIIPSGEYFRVLPHPVKVLALSRIPPEEASYKLVRIIGKRTVKGGHIQLNFHDGRCHVIKLEDPFNHNISYKIYDAMKITLPDAKIVEYIPLDKDVLVSIVGGSNIGKYGKVLEPPKTRNPKQLVKVTLNGTEKDIILKYVFPIGKDHPLIKINGEVV
jgi:small subunit ribosomal protein S4e